MFICLSRNCLVLKNSLLTVLLFLCLKYGNFFFFLRNFVFPFSTHQEGFKEFKNFQYFHRIPFFLLLFLLHKQKEFQPPLYLLHFFRLKWLCFISFSWNRWDQHKGLFLTIMISVLNLYNRTMAFFIFYVDTTTDITSWKSKWTTRSVTLQPKNIRIFQ